MISWKMKFYYKPVAILREQSDQWRQNKRNNRQQNKPKYPQKEILLFVSNYLIFECFELKKHIYFQLL